MVVVADIEVDRVANTKVDMVADMEEDNVADNVVDIVGRHWSGHGGRQVS